MIDCEFVSYRVKRYLNCVCRGDSQTVRFYIMKQLALFMCIPQLIDKRATGTFSTSNEL